MVLCTVTTRELIDAHSLKALGTAQGSMTAASMQLCRGVCRSVCKLSTPCTSDGSMSYNIGDVLKIIDLTLQIFLHNACIRSVTALMACTIVESDHLIHLRGVVGR